MRSPYVRHYKMPTLSSESRLPRHTKTDRVDGIEPFLVSLLNASRWGTEC